MNRTTWNSPVPPWHKALRWARMIFTPLSLIVMGVFIWGARSALADMVEGGAWHYLLASLLLWVAANLLAPFISVQIFGSIGTPLNFSTALRIHAHRLPAKYLPGGIWHSVSRAGDYLALGYEQRGIWLYFVIENVLIVAVTLTLSAALVAPLFSMPLLQQLLFWLPLPLVIALTLFPSIVGVATRSRRHLVPARYFRGLGVACVYWLVVGLAFACYIQAFRGLDVAMSVLETGAVYLFSWCIGYLALFAPQGVGVSEFISGTLLAGDRAAEYLAFLVGFRVLVLVGDLLSWGLVVALRLNSVGYSGTR